MESKKYSIWAVFTLFVTVLIWSPQRKHSLLVVALALLTVVLFGGLTLGQPLVSSEGNNSPTQYANTQVTYTLSLKGADKTTISIDGGAAVGFSKTKTVTLDGSKSHTFQVPQMICQSGWECGTQVTDWKNGKRLGTRQYVWTVPAGTEQTTTYTVTIPEYQTYCVSSTHGSYCYEVFVGYSYQTRTNVIFTPPCKPCQFTFQYTPQYRLFWEDEHSSVGLSQWFDSCASVTLQPPSQYSDLGHPDTVAGAAGVRYAFGGWAIDDSGSVGNQVTMCAPHKATATYLTQYYLIVGSGCNELNPHGENWYNAGATATISVDPQVPIPGVAGTLGGRYIFDGWEERPAGNIAFQTPTANVVMNGPQAYFARCRADYAAPAIAGGGIIIIIILGGIVVMCRITRGGWIICRIIRRIFPPIGGGGGGLPPGGGAFPPNATGNNTLTRPDGTQTQLTQGNLSQVGPGTTVDTGPQSFVRVPTPAASNSQSVIGQSSRVSWLDPNPKTPIPWLKFPGLSQIYNQGSLLLRLDFGKMLLSWAERAATQKAVIILPAGLIGAATSAAMSRWLARIKGTMVLIEAIQDGTAAAITVLEEGGKASSAELWRSDDVSKVLEIHPGKRVIVQTGRRPTKTKVDLAKGLAPQLQDPFGTLHKFWSVPPLSDETQAALKEPVQTPSDTTTDENTIACPKCGTTMPSNLKFCTRCGHKLSPHK